MCSYKFVSLSVTGVAGFRVKFFLPGILLGCRVKGPPLQCNDRIATSVTGVVKFFVSLEH